MMQKDLEVESMSIWLLVRGEKQKVCFSWAKFKGNPYLVRLSGYRGATGTGIFNVRSAIPQQPSSSSVPLAAIS